MRLRKAATVSSPITEISEAGGEWTVKTSTTLKTMRLKFKLGEEFDEKTPDGRDVKARVSFKDGKIVTVQKAKNKKEKSTKSVREMNGGDELIDTMTIDGVEDLVCVQKLRRVNSNYEFEQQGIKTDENLRNLVLEDAIQKTNEAFAVCKYILEGKHDTETAQDDHEGRLRAREARHARRKKEEEGGGRKRKEEDEFERRRIVRVARHARQEERRRGEERIRSSRRVEEEQGRTRRHEDGSNFCYVTDFPPLPSQGNRRRGAGPHSG